MRTLRRILFHVFLALYVVAAPLTILYSLGYIVRPGHERGFVRSGLISIETTPPGARVYVGSSRYARRTPTVIRDLLPGTYLVRLTLPGHQPWNGQVRVQAEKATVLDEVILLPQDLQPSRLDDASFDAILPGPVPDLVLLTRGETLAGQWIYDADDEELRPLLPTNAPGREARLLHRYFVENSPRTLLVADESGTLRYWWCRLDKQDDPVDVTALLPEPPAAVTWDPRSDDEIFVGRHGVVDRLDLDDASVATGILSHVLSLAVYRDHLYALDQSNRFIRASRDGRGVERAGKAPSEVQTYWVSRTGYALRFLDDERVLFVGDEGEVYANEPPHLLVDRGARGLVRDPREPRFLLWDRRRLGWIDFSSPEDERPPAPLAWVHEHTQPIVYATWAHDGTHAVYASGGQLHLLAFDRGGGLPAREIAQCHDRFPFVFSERSGRLYFLDQARRLNAVRILPRRDLLPLAADRADRKEPAP